MRTAATTGKIEWERFRVPGGRWTVLPKIDLEKHVREITIRECVREGERERESIVKETYVSSTPVPHLGIFLLTRYLVRY